MASGVQNAYSVTAASNGTADSAIVASEGQGPGTLNDSLRAIMSTVKKWCKDWQGALVTGGSSTAYTLTTNEVITLADGVSVMCRMHIASGAAPTLNVDSTGAKAIHGVAGTAIADVAFRTGGIHRFTYNLAETAWVADHYFNFSAVASLADETNFGTVRLATNAEAVTGTSTTRAVHPAGLKAHVDAAVLALRDGVSGAYDTLAELAAYVAATAALIPAATSQAQQEAGSSNAVYTTPGRQHFHPGHPKAHGRVNSAGSLQTGDYGIASAVKNSTGNYTVTLDTAMSDTNGTVIPVSLAAGVMAIGAFATTSTITVLTLTTASANAFDAGFSILVFGDHP